jgi:hypothetical protein
MKYLLLPLVFLGVAHANTLKCNTTIIFETTHRHNIKEHVVGIIKEQTLYGQYLSECKYTTEHEYINKLPSYTMVTLIFQEAECKNDKINIDCSFLTTHPKNYYNIPPFLLMLFLVKFFWGI